MNGLSWNTVAIILIVCQMSTAAPNGVRVKRDDEVSLDPTNLDTTNAENDREKRKLPEAAFQSKNAVLGFVFGKIDQLIDGSTRFIDQLDRSNVEKNKQLGIVQPQPIPSFQALISGVISPKISAITQKFGSLSGSFLGGSSGSSSGFSGGAQASASADDGTGGSSAGAGGLSGILSSVLRLSGPILSASIGGGASLSGGGGSVDSTTEGFDDDF
ncbi:CLUMA_CG001037, isoform C [Clunio marinus]|uniref:CLUMA_CG001037, isoform C n=1 Tax=Clunio marinus TaxID=568069 RepID=A0A1J1HI64_9DIPT|nr:CLUMA_CG001037, isoform C [Clunio marinus]